MEESETAANKEPSIPLLLPTPDGSWVDTSGNIYFFSIKRFIDDVLKGNNCYLCGKPIPESDLTQEHILPKWLLRLHDLHNAKINLPSQYRRKYARHKIPCCLKCNKHMGEELEQPISIAVKSGAKALADYMEENYLYVFVWLCNIFFKHLYSTIKENIGKKTGDLEMSPEEACCYEELHHMHCLARSVLTRCEISNEAFGAMFVIQVHDPSFYSKSFDFLALHDEHTIMISSGDTAIIGVLDDSRATYPTFHAKLEEFDNSLSYLQIREVLAQMSDMNNRLKTRPSYVSCFGNATKYNPSGLVIHANLSKSYPELIEFNQKDYGDLLYFCLKDCLVLYSNNDIDNIIEDVKSGKWTFLFDNNGNLIKQSFKARKGPHEN
ncbi:hypothetical protein KAR91_80100 [Candidatus Pacearchaeota archaeon]|nr:hypothetical protein [Candidatus Pacearchaeota archaeon]